VLSKVTELNEEYALTTALKELVGKAGSLSIEAIDAAIKYADENDLAGKLSEKVEELISSAKKS
jgi:recombinational DNA repair protein RecT